jgi:hypothetical protein
MFSAEDLAAAEEWGARQDPPVNRSTAIRLIFRRGLKGLK